MKIAYFDTIGGISGDMTLGAFVSAGLPIDELAKEIGKLNLQGVELEAKHVLRNDIAAVKLDVVISGKQKDHRHLKDIFAIIDGSSLGTRVKADSKMIFTEAARAEAAVHDSSIEEIHFHEVGALDSIVDIVGTAICFEKFKIERVYSSAVKLGNGGFIDTQHGKLPLPAPAAVEILKDYPIVLTDVPYELTTPTGAAIIKSFSEGMLSVEQFRIERIGYGAGTREIAAIPNLLRVLIGDLPAKYDADELLIVETNIDDMNPEIYPYLIERLLGAGANDAFMVPIIMKKGRPGVLLSVMGKRAKADEMMKIIFAETSSIGLRMYPVERRVLTRGERDIITSFGKVTAKVVILDGMERLVPEFEECKRIALETQKPLVEVYKILEKEFSS